MELWKELEKVMTVIILSESPIQLPVQVSRWDFAYDNSCIATSRETIALIF